MTATATTSAAMVLAEPVFLGSGAAGLSRVPRRVLRLRDQHLCDDEPL
jgi:hypothetical protein